VQKVAAYIRVSTAGQNEAGQRQEIDRWFRGQNITDVVYFVDKKSGDNLDRPAFAKMQAAVFNREIDTICVYKLDRISRSLKDGINVLADWCKSGVRVVSVSQQLDFAGATGQLIAAVLFAMAQMEQETRRERQAVGIAAARARGVYLGRRAGSTKSTPEEAYGLRVRGFTDSEIARQLGISRRTVQRYLRRASDRPPSR
jgi:DNA invertase Pin-like site-specific DNA recombinase